MADDPNTTECVTKEADSANEPKSVSPNGKRIGRPPKSALVPKKRGSYPKRGRPPGEAAALQEFKSRLITSPKSKKVLEKIFDAALDDDHKGQTAAWKLIVDRLAPLSSFEKGSGGKAAVTINISGIGQSTGVDIQGESENADIDDIDYEALDD